MKFLLWALGFLSVVNCDEIVFKPQNSFSYELCDTYQAFKIKNVELVPGAPVKGESLTVKVDGFLEKDVSEGSELKTLLKFMRIGLLRKKFDICEELANTDDAPMKCPIEQGEHSWSYTFDIPGNMPSGDYEIHANITSSSDELLLCSKMYFTM